MIWYDMIWYEALNSRKEDGIGPYRIERMNLNIEIWGYSIQTIPRWFHRWVKTERHYQTHHEDTEKPWTSIDNTATFLSKVQASHAPKGCFLGSRCLFGGPFCRSKNPWNSPRFTGEWLGCSEFPYFLTVEGWVLCIFITATR